MPDEQLSNARLDSWKSIAAYLGRDVRTVIRWEQTRGLPVRRLPGETRSAVYAFKSEIDAWLSRQGSSEMEPEVTVAPAGASEAGRFSRRRMMLAGGLAAAALVGAGIYRYIHAETAQPAAATFTTDSVQAWDHHGHLLWEYRFAQPFVSWAVPVGPRPLTLDDPAYYTSNRVSLQDLDGDGQKEVLAITYFPRGDAATDDPRQVLSCFSSTGKLLWSYEPQNVLQFGERTYGPPWGFADLVVSDEPGRKTIWVNVVGYTWGKSFVTRLDGDGHAVVQFVNSGQIGSLDRFHGPQGARLWIGGFNDEYDTASLAIVGDTQQAVSPQTPGSHYACVGCAGGDPLAYFVLPRYEMSRVLHVPNNRVYSMTSSADIVQVRQMEISRDDQVLYEFSNDSDVRPLRVNYAASFWSNHLDLERAGKVDHPLSKCPDRLHPPPVRVYEGGTWQQIFLAGRAPAS